MNNPELALQIFNQLKHAGIRTSIGDFGIGHTSLAMLRRLPINELKIDRTLIDRVVTIQSASM